MYDGTYTFDAERRIADLERGVSVPPHAATVWGDGKPYAWSFAIRAALDPHAG